MQLTLKYLSEELTKKQMQDFFDHLLKNLECAFSIGNNGEEIIISGGATDIIKAITLLGDYKRIL